LLDKTGYHFPGAHYDMMALATLAGELKQARGESLCRLPFCLTVEAEAMGAIIKLDDMKNGPRVRQYVCTHIDELGDLPEIDFTQGRIKAVLDSVEYLCNQDETVALNIVGPFTILSSLIDPKYIYKAIRMKDASVARALARVEENIIGYAERGIARGAKILSYADPAGAMDIIGPQMYKNYSGRVTCNILQRLAAKPGRAVIHLCGNASAALEKSGFCTSAGVEIEGRKTYLEVLHDLIHEGETTRIIGHSCIRQAARKKRATKMWEMRLNQCS